MSAGPALRCASGSPAAGQDESGIDTGLTPDELRDIAGRARRLAERPRRAHAAGSAEIDRRLERWCRSAAAGDDTRFAERLARDGLTVDTVRGLLAAGSLADEEPLPAWAATLDEMVALALDRPERAPAARSPYLDPDRPAPFEEIAIPFVEVARRRIRRRCGASLVTLSPAALSRLDGSLLRRLTFALGPTLALEFKLFRYASQSAVDRIAGASYDGSTALYTRFVRGLLEGGLSGLFREYAGLARIVATLVELHVAATEELVSRLVTDRSLLARSLFGRDPGRVEAVEGDLSDRHFGGRCVVTLQFASGDKAVYKPRSLAMEVAWSRLIEWLGQRGLALEPLRVLDRGAYGWMEHVTPSPCPSRTAAGRYFRRTGQLLAVLHALRASDCHLENLIACGEQPHLIDSETLFHPQAVVDGAGAMGAANSRLAASVLRIGLLPQWEPGPDGLAFDASALGGRGDQATPSQVPEWENVNTDAMTRRLRYGRTRRSDNLARVGDRAAEPTEFAEEIVAGFHESARLVREHRGSLTAPDGPLAAFAGLSGRFILRPTSRYEHLLHTVLAPESLRDGADLDIALDVLAADLMPPTVERLWPLLDAEKDALARLDVPHFAIRCDGDAVEVAPGRSIAGCVERTGLSRAIELLREPADGEAWAGQVATIRAAVYAGARRPEATAATARAEPAGDRPPLSAEDATLRALELARMLAGWAIRAEDGETAWIGLVRDPRTARLALRPLGFDLYDGAPGIALFLAAVHAATREDGFRDLALGALAPLRATLADRSARNDVAAELGLGGAQGLGSIVYALTSSAWLLGEPALLADAEQAARLISQERIDADRELDVVAGAAGAILGLLALHAAGAGGAALERARACGRHLLAQRVQTAVGARAWSIRGRTPLTGFAHGAAGIGYALLRLREASGEAEFQDAAREGFAYESALFAREQSNWPDLRGDDRRPGAQRFMTSWCHGAPGIALSRLQCLDEPAARRDLEAGIGTTTRLGVAGTDTLCCGSFGRGEVLTAVGLQLSRPELLDVARGQAAVVLERRSSMGTFRLRPEHLIEEHSPGLFSGVAGIGYQLLRLASPDQVPSVLLWQCGFDRAAT